MVTFCKEGGGMLLVWALRARSYKTKAEAYHQGIALHPLQGVYLVFVLLPVREAQKFKSSRSSRDSSVKSVKSVVKEEKLSVAEKGNTLVMEIFFCETFPVRGVMYLRNNC